MGKLDARVGSHVCMVASDGLVVVTAQMIECPTEGRGGYRDLCGNAVRRNRNGADPLGVNILQCETVTGVTGVQQAARDKTLHNQHAC
jgi:hypothetical protein